jgi:hypothetical protein
LTLYPEPCPLYCKPPFRREEAIKLQHHTIVSLGFGIAFYLAFRSFAGALICFFSGILVDVDHYVDYVRDRGLNFNLKRFFAYSYGLEYERLFILFHGYEYILMLAVMLGLSDYNLLVAAVFTGYTQHLLFDQFTNPVKPLAYFITYRLKNRFRKECVLTDERLRLLVVD